MAKKAYIGVPDFAQPKLSADGTLGGSAFAVSTNNYYSADYAAWRAFNGNPSDGYSSNVNPSSQTIYITFYNPAAIKVSTLAFTNVPSGLTSSSPKAFSVQGSNDNSAWTTIGSFTNTNNTNGATWSVNLSGGFYKYHRLVITSANTTQAYVNIGEIAITATQETGVARKIKKGYVGVDGKARKIKKAYIGIGGVARPCWSSGELAYYGTITPLSMARCWLAATSTEDYAMFAGGNGNGGNQPRTDFYNKSLTRTYSDGLTRSASQLAGTTVGEYALFGGGNTNGGTANYVSAISNSLTYTTAPNLYDGRYWLAATTVGNYALFGGGMSGAGYPSWLETYNSSLTQNVKNLSTGGQQLAATTVGNYALFGGGQTFTLVGRVDAIDSSLTRTSATALSAARHGLSATTVGEHAVFFGGWASTVVDSYDGSLTLRRLDDLPSYYPFCSTATTVGNYALFGGGYDHNGTVYKTVYVYDASLTRTTSHDLNTARFDFAATTIGNYALFGGGALNNGQYTPTDVVDVYTVD